MADELLRLTGLRFAWPGQADIIRIDDFSIKSGERVFLHGPSGCGKSSLLGLIAGLMLPREGGITFAGTELTTLRRARRDRFRADHLGVIFQQFNLLPYLSVQDNVRLPCGFSRLRARRAGDARVAAGNLLRAMDLERALWSRRADRLSVGQQQRVAAARALIGRPELILADEPTSALDQDRRTAFIELLFEQAAEAGSALLFVSHDRGLAARFDRAVALDDINRRADGEQAHAA